MTEHDPVSNPSHYTSHPSNVQAIEITEHLNFCLGNAFKYAFRYLGKNGLQDLRKCLWYLQREGEMRHREGGGGGSSPAWEIKHKLMRICLMEPDKQLAQALWCIAHAHWEYGDNHLLKLAEDHIALMIRMQENG